MTAILTVNESAGSADVRKANTEQAQSVHLAYAYVHDNKQQQIAEERQQQRSEDWSANGYYTFAASINTCSGSNCSNENEQHTTIRHTIRWR